MQHVFISGPVTSLGKGIESFSRLLSLNMLLSSACLNYYWLLTISVSFGTVKTALNLMGFIQTSLDPDYLVPPYIIPLGCHTPKAFRRCLCPNQEWALFNVRSLVNKSFLVNGLTIQRNLHFVFLVETWHQSVRQNRREDGIADIFSTQFVYNDSDLGEFTSFEYFALELKAELSVLIITLYRPPRYSSLFLQEFSELISLGITRYDRLILNGDLNTHINKKNYSKAVELVNLLDSFELTQHVNEATHQHGDILDFVITTDDASVVKLPISDHHCVFFDGHLISTKTKREFLVQKEIPRWQGWSRVL